MRIVYCSPTCLFFLGKLLYTLYIITGLLYCYFSNQRWWPLRVGIQNYLLLRIVRKAPDHPNYVVIYNNFKLVNNKNMWLDT